MSCSYEVLGNLVLIFACRGHHRCWNMLEIGGNCWICIHGLLLNRMGSGSGPGDDSSLPALSLLQLTVRRTVATCCNRLVVTSSPNDKFWTVRQDATMPQDATRCENDLSSRCRCKNKQLAQARTPPRCDEAAREWADNFIFNWFQLSHMTVVLGRCSIRSSKQVPAK